MKTSEEINRPISPKPLEGLESPFLDSQFFIGESGDEESEARLAVLGEESPFRLAFQQLQSSSLPIHVREESVMADEEESEWADSHEENSTSELMPEQAENGEEEFDWFETEEYEFPEEEVDSEAAWIDSKDEGNFYSSEQADHLWEETLEEQPYIEPMEEEGLSSPIVQHITHAGPYRLAFDRLNSHYGIIEPLPDRDNRRFRGTAALQAALNQWASFLDRILSPPSYILTGGLYRDKPGEHGKGNAIDVDGFWWSDDNKFLAKEAPTDWIKYLTVEASLRKVFGTVLNYDYNQAHQDHWHCDLGAGIAWRTVRSQALFAQRALNEIWNEKLKVDGKWGNLSKSAMARQGYEFPASGEWDRFLDDIISRRQSTRPSTTPAPPTRTASTEPSTKQGINWADVDSTERMRHVMNLLVTQYKYPVNGAAGIVGNLWAESGVIPNRIEGSKPGTPMRAPDFFGRMTDFTPEQVMNRDSKNKIGPKRPGVGLAQWTYSSRRKGLFKHSFKGQTLGAVILYDMDAQVDYLVTELRASYSRVDNLLRRPDVSLEVASDEVIYSYEIPGSILSQPGSDGRPPRLPRSDSAVQAVFARRRGYSRNALQSYVG